jgi:hypothetical protein
VAARGIWVTNEKQLFARADLGEIDRMLACATPDPAELTALVDRVRAFCAAELIAARAST